MRGKNSIKLIGFICVMMLSICFGKKAVVQATETMNVSLQPDQKYQYDVNGDGRAEQVLVKISRHKDQDYSGTMRIFVDDKLAFSQRRKQDPCWSVNLIWLENGAAFFDISSTIVSDDDCIHRLYACKNDKLKSVYDFQKYYSAYGDYYFVTIKGISGNTLNTTVIAQFFTTGSISFDMDLHYEDGVFERETDTFGLRYSKGENGRKNKWTAQRKLKVYSKAGEKTVAYTLKKGDVIKLNQVIYKKNKVYFQVKKDGEKSGYLAASKNYKNMDSFKEAQFAG